MDYRMMVFMGLISDMSPTCFIRLCGSVDHEQMEQAGVDRAQNSTCESRCNNVLHPSSSSPGL